MKPNISDVQGVGHTSGPWAIHPDCPFEIMFDDGDVCPLVATVSGDNTSAEQAKADAWLMGAALHAPHECGDPTCPGVINKRKLDAFDDMLAALDEVIGFQISEVLAKHDSRGADVCKEWVELKKRARAALAQATGGE